MKKIAMHKARKAFLSLFGWLRAVTRSKQKPYRQRSSFAQIHRQILHAA
jgi:hypothetical protein